MFRTYLVSALLGLSTFGYAQYKGWSVLPTQAEEFQRERAESAYRARNPGWGGSRGGGFSGK